MSRHPPCAYSLSLFDSPRKIVHMSEESDNPSYEDFSKIEDGKSIQEGGQSTIERKVCAFNEFKKHLLENKIVEHFEPGFSDLDPKYQRQLSLEEVEEMFLSLLKGKKVIIKSKKNWTIEETLLLLFFVRNYSAMIRESTAEFGNEEWDYISSLLPRRSGELCRMRWAALHKVNVHEAPWTEEEDQTLLKLVQTYGTKKWTAIARELNRTSQSMSFRHGKQCRERWINHLDPCINRGAWSPLEDLHLLQTFIEQGKKWSVIAKLVGNRTENAVKNRWKSLLNKRSEGRRRPMGESDEILCKRLIEIMKVDLMRNLEKQAEIKVLLDHDTTSTIKTEDFREDECNRSVPKIESSSSLTQDDTVVEKNTMSTGNFAILKEVNVSLLPEMIKRSKESYGDLSKVLSEAEDIKEQSLSNLTLYDALDDLSVCLVNKTKKIVYTAEDSSQQKILNDLVIALIRLQIGGCNNLKEELKENLLSFSRRLDLGIREEQSYNEEGTINFNSSSLKNSGIPSDLKLSRKIYDFENFAEWKLDNTIRKGEDLHLIDDPT
eukprot:TRINITY_DN6577_c0_g3_i2.p1 TRINITY_DN6577_c0_g3~~TRINITY_DN6577_c0_g3_i2.p1  ORF type:complete len:548 (-),score=69.73 TRINITY_DN6577_c0_g3_i2:75-1718(-)